MADKPPRALRLIQFGLWGAVVLTATWLFLIPAVMRPGAPAPVVQASLGPGVVFDRPFQMTDQHGRTVTQADFVGRPAAWFYGFTQCPEVCPTTLAEMAALREALGAEADKIDMVFVTVDPERDTVPIMKDYVDYFDSEIIGLVGTLPVLEEFAASRFVYFDKVPLEGGDYTMDHSASIYLTDAGGSFVGTLDNEEPFETRLAKLRNLLKRS